MLSAKEDEAVKKIQSAIRQNDEDRLALYIGQPNSPFGGPQLVFMELCSQGRLDDLIQLYAKFSDHVDITANNHYSVVTACSNGRLEVAKWLRGLGADFRVNQDAPFRYASQNGHLPVVTWLLEVEPDIEVEGLNHYALLGAAINNHVEVVKLILPRSPNFVLDTYVEFVKTYSKDKRILSVLQDKSSLDKGKEPLISPKSPIRSSSKCTPMMDVSQKPKVRNWFW